MAYKRTRIQDVRKTEPLFLQNKKVAEVFREVIASIPKSTKVYLVGGALRNAVFYATHKKRLPQRDYDLVYIGKKDEFIQNLRSHGFMYGKIRRKNQTVLKKMLKERPQNIHEYVVLDISFRDKGKMRDLLKEKVNFTINGFAIPLQRVFSKDWKKSVIALPFAMRDITNRQMRLNADKKRHHGSELYACIRFISTGFKRPTSKEIQQMYRMLPYLPKYKFKRNRQKVFDYVGGEHKAREILKRLRIQEDVFSFTTIEKLRRHKNKETVTNKAP